MAFHMLVLCCLFAQFVTAQKDCPRAPIIPGDRRPDTSKLRIVAFNVEWLFSETSTKSPWTPEQALQHLKDVAKVVAELKPDILSMEEVEDCSMLQRLADSVADLGVPGYVPYMIKGTDTGTGQNVGIITLVDPIVALTRTEARASFPIAGTSCAYTGKDGTSGVSKHYQTVFNINGLQLAMFGVHFVAFPTTPDRCVQREAQASVMRDLVDVALEKGHEVVLLGDFNDYSDKILDFENSVPTSRVMRILRDGGLQRNYSRNFLESSANSSTKLFVNHSSFQPPALLETAAALPQYQRFSSVYDSPSLYTIIDHILMSYSLASRANFSFYHGYPDYSVSDHWPAVVDLDLFGL